jgi:CubicO group peptidase (beta-lactamase class C family)
MLMSGVRIAVIATALVAMQVGTAWAGSASLSAGDLEARVDEFVQAERQREKVPGVAIGIFQHGEIVMAKGYGYANIELQAPVSAETMFQSASVGKQFTAVAVMLQVQDGKLELDESIRAWFPDAPASWQAITVRNLLNHTSGIPDYSFEPLEGGGEALDQRHDYSEDELRLNIYTLPLQFAPGSKYQYSNSGYALLGFLVRRVSGQFYGDVLAKRVFEPLGMKTARVISEQDIVMHRAAGYELVDGQIRNQEWYAPPFNTMADGSLYLSLNDYLAWERGLRAGAILTPQSWEQVYTPVRLHSGKTYPYGFGWGIDQSKGAPWYHHSGSWQGFKLYFSRYLADDLAIVVLTNLSDATPWRFVDGIASLIDPQLALTQPVTPIADDNPAATAQVRAWLEALAQGQLAPEQFASTGAEIEKQLKDHATLLGPLGSLQALELLRRTERGDDTASAYAASYATRKLRVNLVLAPDSRIAELAIEPWEP